MNAKKAPRAKAKTTKGKRSSLGSDPFAPVDALLGGQAKRSRPGKASGKGETSKAPTVKSERASFYLDPALLDELRNASLWFAGPPEFAANVSDLAGRAIRAELDRLRKKHLKGKPIPKRIREPQPGRPGRRGDADPGPASVCRRSPA